MKYGILTTLAIAAAFSALPASATTYIYTGDEAVAAYGKPFASRDELLYFREHGSLPGSDVGAVPEPATWAMMIGGFGLVGAAMRRRAAATA